ncbi:MAG: hypothetical protein WBO55_11530 [Rhizobiaceae bacterium]
MFDVILYRRFMLVVALITALGALAANVIQDTRSHDLRNSSNGNALPSRTCQPADLCGLGPVAVSIQRFG